MSGSAIARVYDKEDRHVADLHHESMIFELGELPSYRIELIEQHQKQPISQVGP